MLALKFNRYLELKTEIKHLENELKTLTNELKNQLDLDTNDIIEGFKVSYTTVSNSKFNRVAFDRDYPDVYDKYIVRSTTDRLSIKRG